MATETVQIVLDQTWRLISNATAGRFSARVLDNTEALFAFGDAAPAAGSFGGLSTRALSYENLDSKVWARGAGIPSTISVARTPDAGNPAIPALGALGLSALTFSASLGAGIDIATITNRLAGDAIESIEPNDGRIVLSSDKARLVRGLTPVAAGKIKVRVKRTHPQAPNSPQYAEFEITVAPAIKNVVQGGMVNSTSLPIAGSKTTFKGRRKFRFGIYTPPELQFVFLNWHIQGTFANREVVGPNDVPITKAIAYVMDADGNQLGRPALVGINPTAGARGFTVPAGATRFLTDKVTPASFALLDFPVFGWIEYRHIFTLSGTLRAPASDQTFFGWSQTFRATAAIVDDVDAFGPMAENTGSADAINIFLPSYCVGTIPGSFSSLLLLGDSMFGRQNDLQGLGDMGGGVNKRAAYLSGLPYFTMAVGGRSTAHQVDSPKCREIYGDFTDTLGQLASNDFGGFAGADAIGTQVLPNCRQIWSDLRAAGHRKILWMDIPPRTADNAWKCTDLAQMTPFVTSALASNGAPRDGYGYGPGEWRDQWNGTVLPGELAAGRIDGLFRISTYTQDPATTWKWRVPSFTATVSSAIVATSSARVFLSAAPNYMDSLVFEPGNAANVDLGGQGGPYVQTVRGPAAGPFEVAISAVDPYRALPAGNGCSKNHAEGSVVRSTIGSDGTHPTGVAYLPAANDLAPILRALAA